jgi:hypothetical protein
MERHALRDDQFARIEKLLPGRPGTVGRNSELGNRLTDRRKSMLAKASTLIVQLLRTGFH